MKRNRENVWLSVGGIVEQNNQWLVVKKKYGGLKDRWSFPAGFVDEGETVDAAVQREILEETGMKTIITGIVGIRSGVIRDQISDNMIIFTLQAVGGKLTPQDSEISEVAFRSAAELVQDPATSLMIHHFLNREDDSGEFSTHRLNPGNEFGYTDYKIFNW